MTSPANYDGFVVGDTLNDVVMLHFRRGWVIITTRNVTNLKKFHQILVSQNWVGARLKLQTTKGTISFEIMPNQEHVTLVIDGQTWNLEDKAIYEHITKQFGVLIDRIGTLALGPESGSLEMESTRVIDFGHCTSIVCSYASGGSQQFHIGTAGFGELVRVLEKMAVGCTSHCAVKSEGVSELEVIDNRQYHCVTITIKYDNDTERDFSLSYRDIRYTLADDIQEWAICDEFIEGYGDGFDVAKVQETLRTRYSQETEFRHAAAPKPAPPVGITDVCKFIMDHPEHHATMLAILHDIAEARKLVTVKP